MTRQLFGAMVFLTSLFGVSAMPAVAQIERITITVDGMTWAFCAIQAERALRRLEGVAKVRLVLAEQKAEIELKPRVPFKPEEFRSAIESASQRVRAFELLLCAAIEKRDGRYYLQPAGVAQRFAAAGAGAASKLEPLTGQQVCARGKLASTGPPLALEIMEVASADPTGRRVPSTK